MKKYNAMSIWKIQELEFLLGVIFVECGVPEMSKVSHFRRTIPVRLYLELLTKYKRFQNEKERQRQRGIYSDIWDLKISSCSGVLHCQLRWLP